jgi:hypothetical protein
MPQTGQRFADSLIARVEPGDYVCVDVSQTKDKGFAICRLRVLANSLIEIVYYHQPFLRTNNLDHPEHIEKLIASWPEELLRAKRILIDSPLCLAQTSGGRSIDKLETWKALGFGEYLQNKPQTAPTAAESSDDKKEWIRVGMTLDSQLSAQRIMTGEVYPTASLNALHQWREAGIDVSGWFANEPGFYCFLDPDSQPTQSPLRFLERLKTTDSYGGRHTRFRKLAHWPYPDLWDAFGGAVTCVLWAAGLTEYVQQVGAAIEGAIIVPSRPAKVMSSVSQESAKLNQYHNAAVEYG